MIIAVVVFVLGVSAIVLGLWQLTAKNITPVIESINYRTVQIVFVSQQKAGNTTYDITPIGTGIIVNNDGYVITAGHFIDAGQQYMQQSQAEIKKLGIIIPAPSIAPGVFIAPSGVFGGSEPPQLTNDFIVIARDTTPDLALLQIKMSSIIVPEQGSEDEVYYTQDVAGTLNVGTVHFIIGISKNSSVAITGYTSEQTIPETKTGKVLSKEIPTISNEKVDVTTGDVTFNFTDYYQTDITANSIFSGSPVYSTGDEKVIGIAISSSQSESDDSGTVDIIPTKYIMDLLKKHMTPGMAR